MQTPLRPILLASILAASPGFGRLGAQSAPAPSPSTAVSDDESHERPPAFATGIAVGTMHFSGGRSQSGVSATLEYSPSEWLTFSATPGFGRTSLAGVSSSGLTDLPISAGASHALGDIPWSPSIFGSLYTTLSLADSTRVLGAGRTAFGASASLSGSATDRLSLTVGASHPLSAQGGNGSIDLESAYSLGKATANLGLSSEVGRADSSATLARSIAGGFAFAVAGPVTLTVDGSHGLTTGAPSWSLSVGLGTAFAGISPLDPSSPLRRLKKVFGARVSATSGYTKGGTGLASCKKAGTC
jgi:hypothetical protein